MRHRRWENQMTRKKAGHLPGLLFPDVASIRAFSSEAKSNEENAAKTPMH